MLRRSSTARFEHAAAAFAAGVTAAVAAFAHMVAGGDPVRSAALAVVVALIAVLRLGYAGRRGIIFSCVSGAVVAQPTLNAIARLLPSGTAGHATTDLGHAATDVSISGVHLLLAALLVGAVVGAEQAFLLLAALQPFARWLRLLTTAIEPPSPARQGAAAFPRGLVFCWSPAPQVLRRGPPALPRLAG
jgi:hypothetical protein